MSYTLGVALRPAKAARSGIMIRDRVAFEATRKIDVVVFDKTGTLTTGERNFAGIYRTLSGGLESDDELLAVAAGIEAESEHSLATAILSEAKKRKIEPLEIKDLMTVPGMGVSGRFDEFRVFAGGPAMLTRQGIDIDVNSLIAANDATELGQTVVFIVRDQYLLGFVTVGDTLRDTAIEAVERLKEQGKRVAMLTGDASGVAKAIAAKLGIDEIYAEVLPHQKADVVRQLQATGATVAMVGDGVNDAPALASANVGIAIGAGTDVAIESAGLVLVSSDPLAVPRAIDLAKRSYSKMVQNLFWAAGYNVLAIPLAAGAFLGIGLVLSPALGAVLMSLSTIVVAANAQLLRR